jgi:hypothetical protein
MDGRSPQHGGRRDGPDHDLTDVVTVATVGFVIEAIAWILGNPERLFSSTVAQWATAGIALMALRAAVLAGKTATQLLRVEQDREDRADRAEARRIEDKRRAHQAEQVGTWVSYDDERNIYQAFGVEILNNSRLPIYDVFATFYAPDGLEFEQTRGVLFIRPESTGYISVPKKLIYLVDTRPDAQALGAGLDYGFHEFRTKLRAVVRFRDTTGTIWQRDQRGILTAVEGLNKGDG